MRYRKRWIRMISAVLSLFAHGLLAFLLFNKINWITKDSPNEQTVEVGLMASSPSQYLPDAPKEQKTPSPQPKQAPMPEVKQNVSDKRELATFAPKPDLALAKPPTLSKAPKQDLSKPSISLKPNNKEMALSSSLKVAAKQTPVSSPKPEQHPVQKNQKKQETHVPPATHESPQKFSANQAISREMATPPKTQQPLLKELLLDADREHAQIARQMNTESLTQKASKESDQLKKLQSDNKDREMMQYVVKLKERIKPLIIIPLSVKNNPWVEIDIVQLPTGQVLSTKIVQSSGDPLLDRAIERAIMQASPLPLPDSPQLFQRNIRLRFRPNE